MPKHALDNGIKIDGNQILKDLILENATPVAFSTPSNKLNSSRPLPVFLDNSDKLFHFKRNKPFNERTSHPKSPVKSAPPISRVFPHRSWVIEKPHAISFREIDDQTVDSVLCSKFYNSDSSELYFEQCFIVEKKLGEGSFGEVMQVKSRDNDQRYAVKRSREVFKSESDRKRKLDEVKKHEKLPPHPNCVKFIKAWEEKQRLYIQTELCSMSLQCYMEKYHHVPIYFLFKYLLDLLHGLQHIHSHGFIHFDVKPANIFMGVDGTCKIGDFGLVVDRSNDNLDNACEGDNKYMAPELLDGVFCEKADIFSLGIALLEIACDLDLPSGGVSWRLLRLGYLPKECISAIPFSLQTIIRWMMTPDYQQRPTVNEILCHPIIISYKQKIASFFYLQSLYHKFTLALFAFFVFILHIFLRPVKFFGHPPVEQSIVKGNNSKLSTKTSNSASDHVGFNDPTHAFSESFVGQDLLVTPNINHNCTHFTPTPRNSSPLAHRTGHFGRLSPDLSPLSHNRARSYKKSECNNSKYSTIVNDFDFFISDNSDAEHSDCDNSIDKLLSSRPKNLLNMLNEVSD